MDDDRENPDKKSFNERLSESTEKSAEDFKKSVEELKDSWDDAKVALKPLKRPLFISLGVVALVYYLVATGPSDAERYCENTESASNWASATARVSVEKRLKDPDSAVFPLEPIRVSRTGDCSFLVVGTVRAKNGFGGYVQNTYMVRTEYDIEAGGTRANLIALE